MKITERLEEIETRLSKVEKAVVALDAVCRWLSNHGAWQAVWDQAKEVVDEIRRAHESADDKVRLAHGERKSDDNAQMP